MAQPRNQKLSFKAICMTRAARVPLIWPAVAFPMVEFGLLKLAHTNKEVELFRGKGCKRCFQTGYKGRVGITEVLIFSQQIKELVLARAGESKIKAAARAEGMKTMREDGLAKTVAGLTTLEEVLRVTAIDE